MKIVLLACMLLCGPALSQVQDQVAQFHKLFARLAAGEEGPEQIQKLFDDIKQLDWEEQASFFESVIYGSRSSPQAVAWLRPQWPLRLMEVGRYELAQAVLEELTTDEDAYSLLYRAQRAELCIARGDYAGFVELKDTALGMMEAKGREDLKSWWEINYGDTWPNLNFQFQLATGQLQDAFRNLRVLPADTARGKAYKDLRSLDYYLAKRKHQLVVERVAERAWTGIPSPEVQRRLARALWEGEGDQAKARSIYEKLGRKERADYRFEASVYLAEIELLGGDPETAEKYWQEAHQALQEWLEWAGEAYAPLETTALFWALGVRIERETQAEVSQIRSEAFVGATERLLDRWDELSDAGTEIAFLDVLVRRQVLADRVGLELERTSEEAALEILWRVQSNGTLARAIGDSASFQQALAETARPHWAPLLGRHGGWGFWIEDGEIEMHPLPDSRTIDDLVKSLDLSTREVLDVAKEQAEWNLADVDLWACKLAEGLLPPQLRESGVSACTIVGASILGNVPLDLLPVDRGETKAALGEVVALDYLPSWPSGKALRERRGGTGALCFYALDQASSRPGQYPLREDQRKRITSSWGEGLNLRTGEDADLDALYEADLEEYGALLLIAHGLEARRALRLPGDEELDANDVIELTSPPLVLLGACRAGRSKLQRGDDSLAGLGDAWFQAGAGCVIASSQDLEQEVVVDIAAKLATAWDSSPAEVLRGLRRSEADPLRRLQLGWVRVLGAGQ